VDERRAVLDQLRMDDGHGARAGNEVGVDLRGQELSVIKGLPPSLTAIPPGCSFAPRCSFARERCTQEDPPAYQVAAGRTSRCHFWEEVRSA
jgi:oligopeptide transport system ATP-binding protein